MVSHVDLVDTIYRDLLQRQFLAIKQREPALYEGYHSRLASYMERGLANLHAVLASAGVEESDLNECFERARVDQRFRFLYKLPRSAALGGARGTALEMGLFSSTSNAVGEFVTLLNIFITILDGLLDEAPALLASEHETLYDLLVRQSWSRTRKLPIFEQRDSAHPVVVLMYDVMVECIRIVISSDAWLADPTLREDFSDAVEAAFLAESSSTDYQFVAEGPFNISACRSALIAKSGNAAWVTALAPICVRGWPSELNRSGYREFAKFFGEYVGWIDDICDLLVDLAAGRWSSVILDLYEYVGQPSHRSPPALRFTLTTALAYDQISNRLVETGGQLYDQLIGALEALEIDRASIVPLIADITQSWLVIEQFGTSRAVWPKPDFATCP